MKITLLFFLTLTTIICSCHKKKNESVEMRIEIPLSITPIKDTINLGDTIFLSANFSDSLKDIIGNKFYRFQNFNFQCKIAFLKLGDTSKPLSQQPGNTSSYTILPVEGSIDNLSSSFGNLNFIYSNSFYRAKFFLIPKNKGVFNLFFFSSLNGHNNELSFINLGATESGGQKIATLTYAYFVVNNGQINYDLLKQNCKLGSIVSPTPANIRDEKLSNYTFVVK